MGWCFEVKQKLDLMGLGLTSLEQAEPTDQEEVIEVAVQQFRDTLAEHYLVEV